MSATLLKKITTKSVLGKTPDRPEKKTEIFRCFGRARSVRVGESAYGPFRALRGEFEAVTPDGEVFQAPEAFLPEPVHGMIAERVEGKEDEREVIEFAVQVSIVPSDSPVGYDYAVQPLVEATGTDSLAHLRQAALPGPSKAKSASTEAEASKTA